MTDSGNPSISFKIAKKAPPRVIIRQPSIDDDEEDQPFDEEDVKKSPVRTDIPETVKLNPRQSTIKGRSPEPVSVLDHQKPDVTSAKQRSEKIHLERTSQRGVKLPTERLNVFRSYRAKIAKLPLEDSFIHIMEGAQQVFEPVLKSRDNDSIRAIIKSAEVYWGMARQVFPEERWDHARIAMGVACFLCALKREPELIGYDLRDISSTMKIDTVVRQLSVVV